MWIQGMDRRDLGHIDPEEVVLEARGCRVFLLDEGRNAWHSTWVERNASWAPLYSDRGSAMSAAEPLRTQGSVFHVEELPGLILRGINCSFILVDCDAKTPFRKYTGCDPAVPRMALYPGARLAEAVRSFGRYSSWWKGARPSRYALVRGQIRDVRNLDVLGTKPFRLWGSSAAGVDRPLHWSRQRARGVSRLGIEELLSRFDRMAAENPVFVRRLDEALRFEAGQPVTADAEVARRNAEERAPLRRVVAEALRGVNGPPGSE